MSSATFRLDISPQLQQKSFEHQHPSLAYLKCPSHRPTRKTAPQHLTTNDVPTGDDTTESHLCKLSTAILNILTNSKDYSDPILTKHISHTSLARKDHYPNANPGQSVQDVLHANAQIVHLMPDLHAENLSSMARVQDNGQKAETWTWLSVSGLPVMEGPVREVVCVMKWKKTESKWMCESIRVVRGVMGV